MATKNRTTVGRQRRRSVTLLWCAAFAAVIITLIYLEQMALLYVLGSLALTGLLVVVMLADLSPSRAGATPAPFDDAAAAADGLTSANDTRRRGAGARR
jgi:hypothetical protein